MSKAGHTNPKNENGEAETPHFFGLQYAGDASQQDVNRIFVKPLVSGIHLRSGDLCPRCRGEQLDYDGLLNLTWTGPISRAMLEQFVTPLLEQ